MIKSIQIKNIALIDNLKITFYQGLNILTGETGSGKSILFQSILFALGEVFDPSFLKNEDEIAFVILEFKLNSSDSLLIDYLASIGIHLEEQNLIIKREYGLDQKLRNFANEQIIPNHYLRKIASMLLDFLSQHSNQSLLKIKNHRKFLDAFAKLEPKLNQFKYHFYEFKKKKRLFVKKKQEKEELKLRFEEKNIILKNISDLKIKAGEDEQLENLIQKYSQAETIFQNLNEAYQDFYQKEASILSVLEKWVSKFETLTHLDPEWKEPLKDLKHAFFSVQNIHEYLRAYRNSFSYSEDYLNQLNERLYQINKLKAIYGPSLKDLFHYQEQLEKENISFSEESKALEQMKKDLEALASILQEEALEISDIRKKNAQILIKNVQKELDFLGMGYSQFDIHFHNTEYEKKLNQLMEKEQIDMNEYGIDDLEFLFSSDSNNLKPLLKIASGGELSRVMLAIKSVLIEVDFVSSLLLDEVDSGIGGKMALILAEKIYELSQNRQIICITHLSQIAVKADHHFKIVKYNDQDIKIKLFYLSQENRIEEIARMLSGKITERSIQHAKELLKIQN